MGAPDRMSYIMEEEVDPKKRYILAEFPHGTFPIGPIVASTLFQTLFPSIPIYRSVHPPSST